jgi:hypothetical protein
MKSFKVRIHHGACDAGLHPNAFTVRLNIDLLPVLAQVNEDAVCNGLARQAGTAGAEHQWDAMGLRKCEQAGNFFF